jgi:glycine cleavage system H protein
MMEDGKKFAILPCNGLDKPLGQIAREIALKINELRPDIDMICPVLLSRDGDKYKEAIEGRQWIVIDGCGTRCATKLAAEKAGKMLLKIYIPDVVKDQGIKIGKPLRIDDEGKKAAHLAAGEVVRKLLEAPAQAPETHAQEWEPREISFLETMVDKFILRVPEEGFLFNENDCWAQIRGGTARIGITDYVQTNAGDIMFVEFPGIGTKIAQFDEAGEFESGKAVLQLISPVSGRVTAVNENLRDRPELLNQDPYGDGWMIELELTSPDEDRELLLEAPQYFEIMVNKAKKEIAGRH